MSGTSATQARSWQRLLAIALVAVLAGCGGPVPTNPASSTSPAGPIATETPATPSDSPSRTKEPGITVSVGQIVVTVSADLRVRSKPRVADDSLKYVPLLPLRTELKVVGGPVEASGYTWYDVAPVDFTLVGGPTHGWVAAADKDGTPWIGVPSSAVASADLASSSVARATADPAAATTAASSINAFGVELYKRMLADPALELADRGVVFSPTSIALALAMARAGAKVETGAQMDRVLHTSGWDALGPDLNALDQSLTSLNSTWLEPEWRAGEQVQVLHTLALRMANAAFAQRGWPIEQEYLDAIASAFGAGVRLVDYIADHEAARVAINAWVSQRTQARIPELIPKPLVTGDTRLVLVNAIYLKANWAKEFPPGMTVPAAFMRLDGSTVQVPTMSLRGEQVVPYAHGTGWQAVELRYRGALNPETGVAPEPLAMTLIMPEDLSSFEKSMSAAQLGRITVALEAQRTSLGKVVYTSGGPGDCGTYPYSVELSMPRFSVATKAQLADALKAAGMGDAFDVGRADFSGIHVPAGPTDRPFISAVIHQANIDVDEKGTEAAAATAIMVDVGGCTGPGPARTITFRLDRPFLFVLRDVATGAVLFMGHVVDPTTRS